MERPDYLPKDYKRIKVVGSLSELFNEQFGGPDEVNCILFPRRLTEDFNALARAMKKTMEGAPRDDLLLTGVKNLLGLRNFPDAARPALNRIRQDMESIRASGPHQPCLRYIKNYNVNTVYQFHADGTAGGLQTGRILCAYNDPVTEWVRNEDWDRGINETTEIFVLRAGDLWSQSRNWPDKNIPPFIHRAPQESPGGAPRLLLVAD